MLLTKGMPEFRCLVEEVEVKISSPDNLQRTILLFISNINIQFGAISTGRKMSFLSSVFIAILLSALVMIPLSLDVSSVYAQGPPIALDSSQGPRGPRVPLPFDQQPPFGQASNFTFGPIASIQNNESGQPAWVVLGFWRSNLLSFNETTTTTNTENSEGNASSLDAAAIFNANLRMIMLNGSGAHTHVITNFILSNVSSNENGTTTYTGNSTVSMPEAPIVDVPTTIKVSGEVISIFPDPSKLNQHFGNTPIYGAVISEEEGLKRQSRGQPSFP
jgi:hypothetical protein